MAISLHYRSFEEGLVGMDSIWTRFMYVLEKLISDFLTKIGRSANEGGRVEGVSTLAAEIR